MLTAIRLASSRSNNFAADLRPGSSSKWTWAKTGLCSAMLLGVVAMLFGLAIGVTISGGLLSGGKPLSMRFRRSHFALRASLRSSRAGTPEGTSL
jgi:hypothetical protein